MKKRLKGRRQKEISDQKSANKSPYPLQRGPWWRRASAPYPTGLLLSSFRFPIINLASSRWNRRVCVYVRACVRVSVCECVSVCLVKRGRRDLAKHLKGEEHHRIKKASVWSRSCSEDGGKSEQTRARMKKRDENGRACFKNRGGSKKCND